MSLFRGSAVALVTPFHPDGKVNFEKLTELVEWQIQEKSDAIVACGTTGEASTLPDAEHIAVIEHVAKIAAGRVQVIGGAGSNDTAHGIELCKEAQRVGADALLCVTPYYNKPSQKGLITSFTAMADAVTIPMILYSVPGRTGVNIEPSTVEELAKHPMIQGIKEASGNIAQVVEIARRIPKDFMLYSGNDEMVLPLLSVGGHGVISVLANVVPRETHDMVAAWHSGDLETAKNIQLKFKPLIDALFCESNPIPVKTALNIMGKEVGPFRLPLTPMIESNEEMLTAVLKAYHLIA